MLKRLQIPTFAGPRRPLVTRPTAKDPICPTYVAPTYCDASRNSAGARRADPRSGWPAPTDLPRRLEAELRRQRREFGIHRFVVLCSADVPPVRIRVVRGH